MVLIDDVRENLLYDDATGQFTWRTGSMRFKIAGHKKKGKTITYIHITLKGKQYPAHRLVWLLKTGALPQGDIDHEDGNGTNNRLHNLRDVTRQVNLQNARRRIDNKSGNTGVRLTKGNKWRSEIRVNNVSINLGTFGDKNDAIAARKAAEKHYGFHPNHGSKRVYAN